MASSNQSEIDKELAALQLVFKGMLPAKVAEIVSLCDSVLVSENDSNFTDFHMLVHSLAGSAGTFGAMDVSDKARELEELLNLLKNTTKLSEENKSKITALVENIKDASEACSQ